jgi:hypothetical protein
MKFCLIFLIIFLIGFAGAKEISVNPGYSDMVLDKNVVGCFNLSIGYDGILQVDDKWSKIESKNIIDYNFSSNSFNLNLSYAKIIYSGSDYKQMICLSGSSPGTYYGAILYKEDYLGMGSWVKVKITGSFGEEVVNIAKITGGAIGSRPTELIMTISAILLIVLCWLLLKLRKKLLYSKKHAKKQIRSAE